VRVIDASADFRLKDASESQEWYQVEHPYPDLLKTAVYGLTEIYHSSIAIATLVANPGCYPTGALLALAPALAAGIIEGDIIVDSKSGVSGAGRSLTLMSHYAECNESVAAYAVSGHRHMPEMLQECRALDDRVAALLFLPHLVPMTRGILSSCYAHVDMGAVPGGGDPDRVIREIYQEYYRSAAFVRVVDAPPATKHVWGSNYCHVFPAYDHRTGRLLVLSAIDNLVKGGAGEAVQNMNLMLGLEETAGLEALPVFP
jgi:N-acetyl-gamma-glutamyl-phosphate reductase